MTYLTNKPSRRDSQTPSERLAKGLGWFSIGLGLVELFAPRALGRAIGLERHERLLQAYGAREIATGVAILASHDPTPWIWGRVGGDTLDIATLATGLGQDNPNREKTAVALAAVMGVTALDAMCAAGLHAQKSLAGSELIDYRDRTGYPRGVEGSRGVARDVVEIPRDFRTPEALRPYELT
jgi:hypothetical protein